jgi:DNA-directed RNA polymerase subunit RPC12/RpoP
MMPKFLKFGLKSFLPSTRALLLAGIAIIILVLGLICTVATAYVPTDEESGMDPDNPLSRPLSSALFMLGAFVFPAMALAVEIATLMERKPPAKAMLGGIALLTMGVGMLLSIVAWLPDLSGGFMVLCYGPVMILFAIPFVIALTKAPPALRSEIAAEQEATALRYIAAHDGAATYAGLVDALDLPKSEVDALCRDLAATGSLSGGCWTKHERFYTDEALERKYQRLLGCVEARGEIPLDDLALEVGAPRGLVKEWIYTLVRNGRFSGYINWDEEVLYSTEANQIRDAGRCPQCGGELGLAGKGVVRCDYCGAEIFLGQ